MTKIWKQNNTQSKKYKQLTKINDLVKQNINMYMNSEKLMYFCYLNAYYFLINYQYIYPIKRNGLFLFS